MNSQQMITATINKMLANGGTPIVGRPIAIIEIRDDLNCERAGFYRAYWTDSLESDTCVTVFGYCTAGHSFRTIRETKADALRHYPGAPCFRNGRAV